MRENAVLFGKASSLVGIITDPPETARGKNLPAIVLLNAGIIHRVGPNRLSVKMARTLAAMGFVVLRFDFSGIGDSKVRADTLPFAKSAISETHEAMNYLQAARGSERFVLMGICSGAIVAFTTACCDPRVVGAVLINARGHLHGTNDALSASISNRTLARHYWRIAFSSSFRAKNWVKAVTGKVDYQSLRRVMLGFQLRSLFTPRRKVSSGAHHAAADMRLLTERGVRLLHVYAEGDEGLDYLHVVLSDDEIHALRAWEKMGIEIIRGANHTFTLLWSQECLLQVVHRWVQAMWNPYGAPQRPARALSSLSAKWVTKSGG